MVSVRELVSMLAEAGRRVTGLCLRLYNGRVEDVYFCDTDRAFRLRERNGEVFVEIGPEVTESIHLYYDELKGDAAALINDIIEFSESPLYVTPDDRIYRIIDKVLQLATYRVEPGRYPRFRSEGEVKIRYGHHEEETIKGRKVDTSLEVEVDTHIGLY